jgi:hypothetical protein
MNKKLLKLGTIWAYCDMVHDPNQPQQWGVRITDKPETGSDRMVYGFTPKEAVDAAAEFTKAEGYWN